MTNAEPGFLGLSSPFGGFLSPGLTTGGGGFGGGFLWSSPFCANAAIDSPMIIAIIKNILCTTFIFLFLLFPD
jgi:hypothetical protein